MACQVPDTGGPCDDSEVLCLVMFVSSCPVITPSGEYLPHCPVVTPGSRGIVYTDPGNYESQVTEKRRLHCCCDQICVVSSSNALLRIAHD